MDKRTISDNTAIPTPAASTNDQPDLTNPTEAVPQSVSSKETIAENQHKEVRFTFRNKPGLKALSSKFKVPSSRNELTSKTQSSNFFSKLNVIDRIETDHGTSFTVDVQPDLRFPFYYFTYEVTSKYPELDVKAHPYTSSFSLVAYSQVLFNCALLVNDLYVRDTKSYFASLYRSDPYRRDYLNLLLSLKVPPFVELLINLMAAT